MCVNCTCKPKELVVYVVEGDVIGGLKAFSTYEKAREYVREIGYNFREIGYNSLMEGHSYYNSDGNWTYINTLSVL